MEIELMASMMCADFSNLGREVKELDRSGIDSFHIDIMDGRYVHNFAMSLNDMHTIRTLTDKPLDVHLMVEHPLNTIDLFTRNLHPGDTVYIHPEAEYHPSTTLQRIIDAGLVPGIAINPGTSIEEVKMLLRIVKKVLVMSVNPGNAAQLFLPYVREKYDDLLLLKDKMDFDIYWDGACGADKIKEYAPLGVKGFVLGTTLLFGKEDPYEMIIKRIREMKF
ncbi:MAG: ribulose-phosphate 3-epimerase [Lachnospiraceae bacterium]|nr:ribulose-phosphate 3-epimerase [Lachnospiraceae bacterium]